MKKDCGYFATLITSLIDNELSNKQKDEVQQHLDDCPECLDSYKNESKVKVLLRERLPNYQAPLSLRSRIRRQLARYGARPGFWEIIQSLFIYRPIPAMLTVAALLIFMLVPPLALNNISFNSHESGIVHAAQLEGEIICLDCEMQSLTGHKIPHSHNVIEKPGLKTKDGKIYTFIQNSIMGTPLMSPEYLKKNVRIEGTLFEDAQYIQVNDFQAK